MKSYTFIHTKFLKKIGSEKGFSIAELLVTAVLGLTIVGMTLSTTMTNRNMLGRDSVRTRLNQNIRGSMDILAADIRIAGENLSASFPAIEIVNGTGTNSDELVIRRALIPEILSLCQQIDINTTALELSFAIPGTTPGCVYASNNHNFNTWRDFRSLKGGSVDAYMYHLSSKTGEFFKYTSEVDDGTYYKIIRNYGAWNRTYPVGSSSMYMLEEWRYKVEDGILKIIQNNDPDQTYNVAFNIKDFQITATTTGGTIRTSFSNTDQWTTILSIEVNIKGEDSFRGKLINRELVGKYFPRNILSY